MALLIHLYEICKQIDCRTTLNEIQRCQGCNVIGYQGTRDPSYPLHFLKWWSLSPPTPRLCLKSHTLLVLILNA